MLWRDSAGGSERRGRSGDKDATAEVRKLGCCQGVEEQKRQAVLLCLLTGRQYAKALAELMSQEQPLRYARRPPSGTITPAAPIDACRCRAG